MVSNLTRFEEINILASKADWCWPEAMKEIFAPRGVNLLVAESANDFVEIAQHRRVAAAIVDMDCRQGGFGTVRLMRLAFPWVPCIGLAGRVGNEMLEKALELDVFSVIDKPVRMRILQQQLHRLFLKKFECDIFAE